MTTTDKTPEQIAEDTVVLWDDLLLLRHKRSEFVACIAQAIRQAHDDAIEKCVSLCIDTANAYRELQTRARYDNDTQSALVHLCEKDTAIFLAGDIRKLKHQTKGGA